MIKPTTIVFLITSSALALFQILFIELYLYWRYLWLDAPMHVLGGSVAALGFLSVRDFLPSLPLRFFTLTRTIIFVLLVAVLWEIFEAAAGLSLEAPNLVSDTVSDLMLGLLGGLIGYFVGINVKKL